MSLVDEQVGLQGASGIENVLSLLKTSYKLKSLTERLIRIEDGLVLNAGHPAWRATRMARTKLDPDGPDPVLHLSAAVAAELCGSHLSADSVVTHLELLAERALGKENREAAAPTESGPFSTVPPTRNEV